MMDSTAQQAAAPALARGKLRDAVAVWARVSLAGIGGPALQIATMHRLLVEERHWITAGRFYHALGYCMALPGPETQQLAVYVGWLAHRTIGGITAGVLFILPGVVCMMALSFGFVMGADSQFGQAIFFGVRPAILAVMTEAILRFGRHVLYGKMMIAVALLAFVAAYLKLAFPIIVVGAGVIGAFASLSGQPFAIRDQISDQKPYEMPAHARASVAYFVRSLTTWLVLWLAPTIALLAIVGAKNVYTKISLVFAKVALMAIGGDYAVVAYAAQQSVDFHHWISAAEMQEAIAMGEMVPGTIMIVTQFLGFITAFRNPGALPPLVAGGLGGLLATWMTFVPCFLFILVFAPLIEGLRNHAFLNSLLSAVMAAAVGMIINLSVWFGIRTLFHQIEQVRYAWLAFDMPKAASLDPWALALFIVAAIAVLRFKLSAAATLVGSSAIGLALLLLGLVR